MLLETQLIITLQEKNDAALLWCPIRRTKLCIFIGLSSWLRTIQNSGSACHRIPRAAEKVALIIGREKRARGPNAAWYPGTFCNSWGEVICLCERIILCCFSVWCLHRLSVVSVSATPKAHGRHVEIKAVRLKWKLNMFDGKLAEWIQMCRLFDTNTRKDQEWKLSHCLFNLYVVSS